VPPIMSVDAKTPVLAGLEGTVMSARNSSADGLGTPARGDLRARDRANAIIGHRLPNGRLYIHAPTESCTLCDRALHVTS
jgi:hypothetical protein